MIELNLLPDVKQEFVHTQRLKRLIIAITIFVSIAAIAIVVLLAFYTFVGQPVRGALADNDIKKYSNELKNNKSLGRDLTLQNQLATLTQLHQDKGVYSRFFDYLKTLNPEAPNNISISQATIDATQGVIQLEASGKNYQAVLVFQDTLKNAKLSFRDDSTGDNQQVSLFTNISITDTALSQDTSGAQVTAFKATLTYDPQAFAWSTQNPTVTVPSENTTPSASRVTSSVFADNPLKKKEGQ